MKFLSLLILLPLIAFGGGGSDVHQSHDMNNQTTGDIAGGTGGSSVADSSAEAFGGDGSSQNEYNTNNESDFFALSLQFPNAVGCFGGAQAGGGTGGGAGFFGFHKLNVSCWVNQLAEAEKSIDIRARLKCGDKHFRQAINMNNNVGTKAEEMHRCVNYVKPIWEAEIQNELNAAQKYKAELECAYIGGELTLSNKCVLDE